MVAFEWDSTRMGCEVCMMTAIERGLSITKGVFEENLLAREC